MNTSFIDDSTYFIVPIDYSYEGVQRQASNITPRRIGIYRYLFLASLPLIGIFLIVCTNFHLAGWTVLSASLILILIAGLLRVWENKPDNHHIELPNPVYLFLFDSGFIITDDYSSYPSIPADKRDSILERLYLQKIPYSDLCSIKESEKDFYLLTMERGGLTVRKEDCSPGALHFLSTLKNNTSKSKNSFAEDNRQTANTQDLPLKSSSPQMGSENSIPRTDIPDIGLVDDTNYFLIPIDTSAEGFCRSVSATLPMWWKIAVGLYVPVSLILAVFCTAEKEYELCIFLWIILSVLILLVLGYRPILKLLHNSNELLQKKHSIFLFDSGYTVSGIYLAYSDIPAGQRNRKLNSLYTHKLPYTTLYGLHESKGYYYISVTYNTVYAIRKSDCSPNAQAFLRNLKTAVDSQKR